MSALRARRPPTSAALIIGAVGLLAIDILRGGQGEIPAAAVVGLVLGIRAVSFLADWRRVIITLLLVILLIPNDGRYTLPAVLPFQLEPYRVVVGIFLVGWLASLLVDPGVRFRNTGFEGPLLLMTMAVCGSAVANPARVSLVESYVIKSVWLFVCFVLVVYMIVSVIRTRETLDRVIAIMVGAGCIVAVAAVIQMKTGMNFFDDLHLVLPLNFNDIQENILRGGRVRATASAGHPIELSATMSMLMPFAIYLAVKFRKRVWWLAFVLLLLGEFASGSKTGMLGVAAMVGTFLWLRPRQTLRFWPAIVPMFVLVHVLAPGALGGLYGGFFSSGGLVAQQGGTVHGAQLSRTSRLPTALHEFSEHNPLLGEGYGTRVTGGEGNFQASTAQTISTVPTAASVAMSRGQLVNGVNAPVLDDQWLKTLLETGILGVLAWVWLFVRAIRRLGARAKTERGSPDGLLPVALAAALLGFAIQMGTYDAFSFVQATALTFILIGFSSIVLHLAPAKPDDAAAAASGSDFAYPDTYSVAGSRCKPGRNRAAEERRDASHSPSRTSGDPKPRSRAIPMDRRRFVLSRGGERLYHVGPVHSTESDITSNQNIEPALDTPGVEFEPAQLGRRPQRSAPPTPEELLEAHATLMETRRSAQTAGVKAGATRRIRKIEAALTDRGVEFQPAPLSRSRGSSATPSTPEQLLADRAAWIEAYQAAETAGQRQGASRRIRNIERKLDTPGVEFEPAQLGRRPQRSAPPTPEELLEAHATLMETRRSAQTAGVKAGATRRIRKIEAALTDRGVEFQPAPLSRSRGSSATPSTPEQLLADRAAWIEAYQAAETAGQRQGASRRIRNIERKLDTPGVEFEPAQLGRRPQRSAPPTEER